MWWFSPARAPTVRACSAGLPWASQRARTSEWYSVPASSGGDEKVRSAPVCCVLEHPGRA
jgi:hypothetical protein